MNGWNDDYSDVKLTTEVMGYWKHDSLPSCRFQNERDDDRSMEVGWREVQAEEKRSGRLGRKEDLEAEKEERAELERKMRRKKEKKNKMLKKGGRELTKP